MLRFRRVVGIVVAGTLLLTNVMATYAVEKSLWEERRAAVERSPRFAKLLPSTPGPLAWDNKFFGGGSTTSQPPSNFKNLALPFDVASAVLPFGAIGEVHEGRRGAPVVFLVQDVHGNDGAQKNIGGLLGGLSAQGITLTGVEGAWGPLDLNAFHRHPSPKAVSLVAEALRASGRLSGSEWAGVTSPHPPTLVGVETPNLYHANVVAARECVARRPFVADFLHSLTSNLKTQKDRVYLNALKNFDNHREAYYNGQESLGEFSRYLSRLPGAKKISVPQVKKFLEVIDWEDRLDFDKIETDRRNLMERLSLDLDQRDLNALLARAVDYRTGKTTNGDFYTYLKTLCEQKAIPLASYSVFANYIAFVGLAQTINRGDLLKELSSLEATLGARLASTVEEKTLFVIDRDVSLLRQLLENEMSPEAWVNYRRRRGNIVDLPSRLKGLFDFQEPSGGLVDFIQPHEDFCRLAMERNGALAHNLMATIQSKNAPNAVLVTGGFHTPGLLGELHKKGVSTIVVTPRIEKIEGKPLDVFARDPLPFDQLFAGKPISLSPKLLLGNRSQKKIMGGEMTVEALRMSPVGRRSDDLKEWVEDQGFEVTAMTRSPNDLVRLEVLIQGIEVVFLSGPKEWIDSAKIPEGAGRKYTSLPNGDSILSYVVSFPTSPSFIWDLIKKGTEDTHRVFLKWGRILVPSGKGLKLDLYLSIGRLFSLFVPIRWVSAREIIPHAHSLDSKSGNEEFDLPGAEIATPDENVRFEVAHEGSGVTMKMFNSGGNFIGSLVILGARGDVALTNIKIKTENKEDVIALLLEVARTTLFEGGVGRLFIPRVEDEKLLWAALALFDRSSLLVAKSEIARSKTDRDWPDRMDTSNEEGILSLLRNPYQTVDICGSLSLPVRKKNWSEDRIAGFREENNERSLPMVRIVKVDSDERDTHQIIFEGKKVGFVIAKVRKDVVQIFNIRVAEKPVNYRGLGIGSAVIRYFSREAARLLFPRQSLDRTEVPMEIRTVENPWIFNYAMDEIFEPDSVEIVEVGNNWIYSRKTEASDWDSAIGIHHPQFGGLTTDPANIDKDGHYKTRFHMRGQLRDQILVAARNETLERYGLHSWLSEKEVDPATNPIVSNGLFLFSVGVPIDPILGSLLVLFLVVAMVYQDKLLNWLALNNAPSWFQRGVRTYVPDMSTIRSVSFGKKVLLQINSSIKAMFSGIGGFSSRGSFGMLERAFRLFVPGFFLRHYIRSSSDVNDRALSDALDSNDIEHTYAFLAQYFGLRGVAVDAGSSSFGGPAKGLRTRMEKVFLLDHLHRTSSEVSPGIVSVPGDATVLSTSLGTESMDVVYFHRSLHHIVVDKETVDSLLGQKLLANGESPDNDPFFYVEILSHVMSEAHQSLKPGGRLMLYFAPHTFRLSGPLALLGWELQEMLQEKGFQSVQVVKSAGGVVFVTGLKPRPSGPLIDDSLTYGERQVLKESLLSLSPRPREDMPPLMEIHLGSLGGEAVRPSVVPESLSSNVALARMVRGAQERKTGLFGDIAGQSAVLPEEKDAAQSGANAALHDEVNDPWSVNMDWAFTKNLVSLIVDVGGHVGSRLSVFESAYNSIRSRIWRGRLIGGKLASTNGLVLNISPLFDSTSGDVAPEVEAALIHLGLALEQESGLDSNPPLELLVDNLIEQQVVENRVLDLIPDYLNLKKSGRLRLRKKGVDRDVFTEGGISLMGLHEELALTVVGVTEDELVEGEIQSLKQRGITFIHWFEVLTKQVEKALEKLVFLRIMA